MVIFAAVAIKVLVKCGKSMKRQLLGVSIQSSTKKFPLQTKKIEPSVSINNTAKDQEKLKDISHLPSSPDLFLFQEPLNNPNNPIVFI